MSAIIPGIALINNFDANGELMRGAELRIYEASTTTPVIAYKDSALTVGQEYPWPIQADAAGRIPWFYVEPGIYRARLAAQGGGYVAYDIPFIDAISPSGSGGGGGGGSVSPDVIWQTGDLKVRLGIGVHQGFARLNGRSIGSATSGATERANADTQDLYEYCYSEFNDTICPVAGGRGASASADFNANKALTLIDGRGRSLYGADGMGASRANRLTTLTFSGPDDVGTGGGLEKYVLTQAQLPATQLTFAGDPMTVTSSISNVLIGDILLGSVTGGGDLVRLFASGSTKGQIFSSGTPGGRIDAFGASQAHPSASPGLITTYYVKL